MDYESYNINIIKILPNIFVGDQTIVNDENILNTLNIKYLININNTVITNKFITLDINIDETNDFIDSQEIYDVNFIITNDFICKALLNNSNVLICYTNYTIPFLILGAFILKYNDLTYTECIYWLYYKFNLHNKMLSNKMIYQLFLYNKELE